MCTWNYAEREGSVAARNMRERAVHCHVFRVCANNLNELQSVGRWW